MTLCGTLVLHQWTDEEARAASALLKSALRALPVSEDAPGQGSTPLLSLLELATEELCTNIFKHSYDAQGGQATLECHTACEEGRRGILLRVTDGGPPFNPFTEAPVPNMALDCEQRNVGGLGIFLIKSVTARFTYTRQDQSNRVELLFLLPKGTDTRNDSAPLLPTLLLTLGAVLSSLPPLSPWVSTAAASAQSGILHHEVMVENIPAQNLRPFHSLQPQQPEQSAASAPTTGTALGPAIRPDSMIPREATPSPPRKSLNELPTEYLLDYMDVQTLSPHAALLALPRMVPPPLAQALLEGAAPPSWEGLIAEAAQRHSLPPQLIAAVIKTESNFRPDAVSHKGAQGLMQLMPATQHYLGVEDAFDPRANVLAGCDYLRRQWERFGSLDLALAAYNAGPENVVKYGGIPPFAETQNFVRRVRARMGEN